MKDYTKRLLVITDDLLQFLSDSSSDDRLPKWYTDMACNKRFQYEYEIEEMEENAKENSPSNTSLV